MHSNVFGDYKLSKRSIYSILKLILPNLIRMICAIIPARGGSKGIPGKNLIPFCGKPLLAWSIKQAEESGRVDKVFVSSDDDAILRVAEEYGAIGIKRPSELATDTASSEGALKHAINCIKEKYSLPEYVVFLQATSPLRTGKDIDDAISLLESDKADSLFSAALLEDFCIWTRDSDGYSSFSYDYKNRGRRQERKPLYLENGSIYLFKPLVLEKYGNRLGGKISSFYMDYWKSYEIDKKEDIELCEYFMRKNILKLG